MNTKKWVITVMACSALALGACGGQNKSSPAASPHKVYRAGMSAKFTPSESQTSKGNTEGFDADLMNVMTEVGNFKMEFKHQPWESLFPSFGNSNIDIIISGVAITNEHKQPMGFGDSYSGIVQAILVLKGKKVASPDDLENTAKVGVVTGQTGDFSVSKPLDSDNPKISRSEVVPLIIKELENKGLNSMVSDNVVITGCVKNNPTKDLDFITLPDFFTENHGIAVRKGDEAAVKMLNDVLKKVRESDKYDKICVKYFVKEEAKAGKAEKTK